MQKLANSEKNQELERLANLALQGLKDVRHIEPQPPSPQISPPVHNPQPSAPVNIVNSVTAKVAPSSSRYASQGYTRKHDDEIAVKI